MEHESDNPALLENTGTLTRSKNETKEPSLYKVIILNDDFTTREFVVHVLQKFFRKSETEATSLMLQVHHQGRGIAGVYTIEIAETKIYQVHSYAKKNQFPLKLILEQT